MAETHAVHDLTCNQGSCKGKNYLGKHKLQHRSGVCASVQKYQSPLLYLLIVKHEARIACLLLFCLYHRFGELRVPSGVHSTIQLGQIRCKRRRPMHCRAELHRLSGELSASNVTYVQHAMDAIAICVFCQPTLVPPPRPSVFLPSS
ncbi:uncharacterized protein LOC112573166 [Pomacea canaliculata]|uniref:uncharacterized protein LOC112573166 n=1 Tax=Pomacea canaliculata TaxID=400727 RepID=UPI000D732573|nr:uncharacterized protein LOC112573166 [Pomacea canaliculata]